MADELTGKKRIAWILQPDTRSVEIVSVDASAGLQPGEQITADGLNSTIEAYVGKAIDKQLARLDAEIHGIIVRHREAMEVELAIQREQSKNNG